MQRVVDALTTERHFMTIGVPKETAPGERRVALVPGALSRLTKEGIEVLVEAGAGEAAYHADVAYEEKGARVVDRAAAFQADVVAKVQSPSDEELALMQAGGVLISFLAPLDTPDIAEKLAAQGVTALSMELVPRISRAQKMDALGRLAGAELLNACDLRVDDQPHRG